MATTTHDKDNECDRRLPPLPLPPLPKDEDKDTPQASSSSPLPSHANAAAFILSTPVLQDASAWAYKIVRGSLYVVGPAIEALAETGHALCMHQAAASTSYTMVRSLEPGT